MKRRRRGGGGRGAPLSEVVEGEIGGGGIPSPVTSSWKWNPTDMWIPIPIPFN